MCSVQRANATFVLIHFVSQMIPGEVLVNISEIFSHFPRKYASIDFPGSQCSIRASLKKI